MNIKKLTSRHYAGYEIITNDDGSIEYEGETMQCCHCSCHFRIQPSSGKVRGWCLKHNAVTCGNPSCDFCRDRFGIENLKVY